MISDRLKILFSVLCSLFLLLYEAPYIKDTSKADFSVAAEYDYTVTLNYTYPLLPM